MIRALVLALLLLQNTYPTPGPSAPATPATTIPTPLGQWYLCGDTSGSTACTPSSSTSARDTSGNGFHGTWAGSNIGTPNYWYTTGLLKPYAGSFDGTDNMVTLGTGAGLLAAFASSAISVSCWFDTTTVAVSRQVLIGQAATIGSASRSLVLNLATNSLNVIATNGSSTTQTFSSSTNVTANAWHYAVATYNGTTVVLYLDGTQTGSGALTGTLKSISNTFQPTIGSTDNAGTGGSFFTGALGPCVVYSSAISAGQVRAIWLLTE